MDNLSHTVAGMLLAESLCQWRARHGVEPSRSFRFRAFIGSCVANNLPDIDVVYRGITEAPLGYLLHHRGHTHTIPVALALGAAVFAGTHAGSRSAARGDAPSLLLLCLLGPLVHIAMDGSNSYGVHPFWPLDERWVYGDSIFIVEPWFWVVSLPSLAFAMRTRLFKSLLWLALGGALVAAWALHVVAKPVALGLTLGAGLMAGVTRRALPARRITLALGGSWLVAMTFSLASRHARGLAARSAGLDALHDVVLTPFPGNPLCFDALALGIRAGRYVTKRGTIAPFAPLAPSDTRACRQRPDDEPTAPFLRLRAEETSTQAVYWHGEWSAPAGELARLARERCEVAAFTRFSRAPYWTTSNDELVVGDVRYDRQPGRDFADMFLPRVAVPGTACPQALPPWKPPRADLLSSAP